MSISVRKTIIEVDVSQAVRAEAILRQAQDHRRESARALAAVMEAAEREQIDALKASTDETRRAMGARREAALAAKQALAEATQAERDARRELAERVKAERDGAREQLAHVRATAAAQREAETARRQAAAQQRSFLEAVAQAERDLDRAEQARLADSRAKQLAVAAESEHHARVMAAYGAEQSAILRRQEQALLERAKAERIIGNEVAARQADMQRELVTVQRIEAVERERAQADYDQRTAGFGSAVDAAGQRANEQGMSIGAAPVDSTRKWKDAVDDVKRSYVGVAAGVGNIITGIQSAVALSREVVTFVDDTVRESFEVQAIARNLQLDIGPAREALRGLVADKDLALAANKAVAMGVAQTGVEFAHIAEMVSQQAVKLGKDATQLISDYTEAVGKQEAEIFDNLGLGALRLEDAYQIQADALGKSVKDLTAAEKATAFQVAALQKLEQATGRAAVGVGGFAESWVKASVSLSNMKAGFLGFEDTAGRVNEALRVMSDQEIDRLGRLAKDTAYHGQSLKDIEKQLGQWRLSLADIKKIADEQGISFEQLLANAKAAHAEQAARLKEQAELAAEQQRIQELSTEAEDQEHLARMLAFTGAKKSEIQQVELDSLMIQLEAAQAQAAITKSAEDEARARKVSQQIELKQAEIEFAKTRRGGGRRDPNEELDRRTAATLRLLKAEEQIVEAQIDGSRSIEEKQDLQQRLNELATEELDVREKAALSRKVKGAKDEDKREAELLEISTARKLHAMDVDQQTFEQEKENAARRIAAMDREIELNEALGVSVGLLQRNRAAAELEYAEKFLTTDDVAQVRHDQAIARIEELRAAKVAAAQTDLDAYNRDVELMQARGSQEQDFAQQRIDLELRVAQAAGDADAVREAMHQRELARIKREVDRRKLATSASNQLLTQGMGLLTMVTNAAVKDEAKREKVMLRARGIEAMARGALETVEAVAAFASFNYVQGALHTAAAAVAFGTGISLLAGKVPNKGGASASAGGGAGHQTVIAEDTAGASAGGGASGGSVPVPPSAEELIRLREGAMGTVQTTASKNAGGNVYNIGTIYSGDAGTLINDLNDQTARKWGTQ